MVLVIFAYEVHRGRLYQKSKPIPTVSVCGIQIVRRHFLLSLWLIEFFFISQSVLFCFDVPQRTGGRPRHGPISLRPPPETPTPPHLPTILAAVASIAYHSFRAIKGLANKQPINHIFARGLLRYVWFIRCRVGCRQPRCEEQMKLPNGQRRPRLMDWSAANQGDVNQLTRRYNKVDDCLQ